MSTVFGIFVQTNNYVRVFIPLCLFKTELQVRFYEGLYLYLRFIAGQDKKKQEATVMMSVLPACQMFNF